MTEEVCRHRMLRYLTKRARVLCVRGCVWRDVCEYKNELFVSPSTSLTPQAPSRARSSPSSSPVPWYCLAGSCRVSAREVHRGRTAGACGDRVRRRRRLCHRRSPRSSPRAQPIKERGPSPATRQGAHPSPADARRARCRFPQSTGRARCGRWCGM